MTSSLFSDDAKRFLESVRVEDLIPSGNPFIALKPTHSIAHALQVLNDYQITSAPVYDDTVHHSIGFVDTLDIAVFVVHTFIHQVQNNTFDPIELERQFLQPISSIVNTSGLDAFVPINIDDSLFTLLKSMVVMGLHRMPVFRDKGHIVGVVSQFDVITYLYKNAKYLDFTCYLKLDSFKLDKRPVITIQQSAPVIEAFKLIINQKITGVAVVDADGHLVNNISASDLKGITKDNFYKLSVPIHVMFSLVDKLPAITVSPTTTLNDILGILTSTGVHRLFVIDEQKKPISIITLTDILQIFTQPEAFYNRGLI